MFFDLSHHRNIRTELVAHGFGYSLLSTKPAATMSYDGNALVTRPLSDETRPSQVVLAHRAGVELGAGAKAFAAECRDLFVSNLNSSSRRKPGPPE